MQDNSCRGRVQTQIVRALVGTGRPMATRELAAWAYPRSRSIVEWHLSVVRRAADRIAIRVGRRTRSELVWALKSDPSVD
jgi:hypothetical protein